MTQNTSAVDQTTTPKPPFVLAIDVGTSSTRTLLFDSTGAAVAQVHAQRTYKLTVTGQGEVSVNADDLVELVGQTIDDALNAAGPLAGQIAAVAIDTFWHSLVGVDEKGKAITPVITWEDTRPHAAAMELRTRLDETAVHGRTGARFHASYWPAKLRWLATEEPDIFKRVSQWLSFGEYLHRQFLGKSICSLSMASGTGMLNTRELVWDSELIKVLDIRPEQLPELGDLGDSIQGLKPEYASEWPALRNVPWFPATGDGAAACVGSGCATIENWSLTIGTSSAIRVVVPLEEGVTPSMSLWLYLIDKNRAVLGGALSEGGNMLNWLDSVLKLPSLAGAEALVASLPPDSHGLTILPFISGERSLGWHSDARMTITGITTHATPSDLLRAGQEALAYQLYAVYGELYKTLKMAERENKTPKLIGSGGALLGSHTLKSIIADIVENSIYPSADSEASARGAALLALEAMGVISDIAKIEPDLDAPIQPDAKRGTIYRAAAKRQQDLYQKLLGS